MSEVPEILVRSAPGVLLGAGPVAAVPTCKVLKMCSEVEGRVRVQGGDLRDVSVVVAPPSDTGTWECLSKIDSVGCAGRRRVECCADRVFVGALEVCESYSGEWKWTWWDDVVGIAGEFGVELDGEESVAAGDAVVHSEGGERDVVGGPDGPGVFLGGGECPVILICGFEDGPKAHSVVGLAVAWRGAAFCDRAGLADVKGYAFDAAGDWVLFWEEYDYGHVR